MSKYLGVKTKELPMLLHVTPKMDRNHGIKYKFGGKIWKLKPSQVGAFINAANEGNGVRHFNNGKLPTEAENSGPLKTIV